MDRRSIIIFAPSLMLGFVPRQAQPQGRFRLTLVRTFESSSCTTGELFANGKFICHTLELPWKNNKSFVSSIPSKAYGSHLRYDKDDRWRIELDDRDTNPREKIQIHVGNTPADIEGCILPGMEVENSNSRILHSSAAYAAIKSAFYGNNNPVATPDVSIVLDIRYNVLATEYLVRDEAGKTISRYVQNGFSWHLVSDTNASRHVWDEVKRTSRYVIFKGVPGSGVWSGRFIRALLHGQGAMEVSGNGTNWSVFAEGNTLIRRDETSKI